MGGSLAAEGHQRVLQGLHIKVACDDAAAQRAPAAMIWGGKRSRSGTRRRDGGGAAADASRQVGLQQAALATVAQLGSRSRSNNARRGPVLAAVQPRRPASRHIQLIAAGQALGAQRSSLEQDEAQLAILHLLVHRHRVAELLHRHVLHPWCTTKLD